MVMNELNEYPLKVNQGVDLKEFLLGTRITAICRVFSSLSEPVHFLSNNQYRNQFTNCFLTFFLGSKVFQNQAKVGQG